MLLSIIIPVYNAEKTIDRCIKSIICEQFYDIEIILVDDGSIDSSYEIIKRYCNKYDNIKCLKQKNFGQGKARNNGLKICNGKYITFIDSDDYITNGQDLIDIVKDMDDRLIDIAIYNYNIINHEKVINNNLELIENKIFNSQEVVDKFLLTNEVEGFSCNKIFKREILINNKIMFIEKQKYEDIPMVIKAILKSDKIIFCNKKIYNYVIYENSTTRKINIKGLLDEIKSLDIVSKDIIDHQSKNKSNVGEYILNRTILFTRYRIKNLLKRKIKYSEFKYIIKEYSKLNQKYCDNKILNKYSKIYKNRIIIFILKFYNKGI